MSYSYTHLQHVYVHWPFCPYKCHFCDFVAMASHEQFMAQYHVALIQEIKNFASSIPGKQRLETLYFGGGTPSTYPAHLLLDTFATLRELFDFDQTTEVTIEVNPGTVTQELLKAWKQAGVNRLSIGVQSLKDIVLSSLNRHQTRADVVSVLSQASQYFDNLSVDFIIGLPGVSDDEWKAMIHEAMSWPIQHISIYFLTVHDDTPLYFKVASKKVQLPPDDAMVDLYDWTIAKLAEHGFERYEVSNFARKGFQSRHNSAYWDRKPYRGFGLGACSLSEMTRFQNTKNLGKYIESLTYGCVPRGCVALEMSEDLSKHQIMLEKLMLGLRQSKGVVVQDYLATLSPDQHQLFWDNVQQLQEMNLLILDQGAIRLTARGYALENEVTLRLFAH